MFEYPVQLGEAGAGGYVITFPDVPEAITQGETRDEALLVACDALKTALSMYVESNRPIPEPSPAAGRPVVRVDARLG